MSNNDVITLSDIANLVGVLRWQALAGLVLGAVVGLGSSFFIEPVYQAQVTVLPADDGDAGGLSALSSQVGGLAALAGLNIDSSQNKTEGLEYLKSNALALRFINEGDLMPVLFAEEWDAEAKDWKGKKPTDTEAVRRFHERTRRVSEDRRTGVVMVSMQSPDPARAQQWANNYVRMANHEMRSKAIDDAHATMDYLSAQIEKTATIGVREALFRTIEAQLKTEAMANVREDFAFKIVDPALLPDEENIVRPRRAVMTAAGAFVGAFLFALVWWLWSRQLLRSRSRA